MEISEIVAIEFVVKAGEQSVEVLDVKANLNAVFKAALLIENVEFRLRNDGYCLWNVEEDADLRGLAGALGSLDAVLVISGKRFRDVAQRTTLRLLACQVSGLCLWFHISAHQQTDRSSGHVNRCMARQSLKCFSLCSSAWFVRKAGDNENKVSAPARHNSGHCLLTSRRVRLHARQRSKRSRTDETLASVKGPWKMYF